MKHIFLTMTYLLPLVERNTIVLASDSATATDLCNSARDAPFRDLDTNPHNSNMYFCFYHRVSSTKGNGGARSSSAASTENCGSVINLPLTGLQLHAIDGMNSGIQFRRLDNCGIGDQSVIDMGFLDAVDIWSNIGSGYSVCFPQEGRIVFLDAATSPRTLVFPDYHFDDGWTCASLDRAGTMVLVKSSDTASSAAATTTSATVTRRPGTDDSVDDAIALEDCLVTPRLNLRLRREPWGTILDVVPSDTAVEAKARTQSWLNVTYLEQEGWMAAWLADSEGDCDWIEDDADTSALRAA